MKLVTDAHGITSLVSFAGTSPPTIHGYASTDTTVCTRPTFVADALFRAFSLTSINF
jgi:hypothetical protein